MYAGYHVCPDRGGNLPFNKAIGAPLMLVDKRGKSATFCHSQETREAQDVNLTRHSAPGMSLVLNSKRQT